MLSPHSSGSPLSALQTPSHATAAPERSEPRSKLIKIASDLADPWVTTHRGRIYLTGTEPTYSQITIRTAYSLDELPSAAPRTIYTGGPELWAPELHFLPLNGRRKTAAVIFTEGEKENHRLRVLVEERRGNIREWKDKGAIEFPGMDTWAIDGTYFLWRNQLHVIWSGWPGFKDKQSQNLYIARMTDPWTPDPGVERVCISIPTHPWESWINEAPQIYARGRGALCLFSAHHSWEDDYAVGALIFDGSDPLNPDAWCKLPMPVLRNFEIDGEEIVSPGHGSILSHQARRHYVYHRAKARGSKWDREVVAHELPSTGRIIPDFHPRQADFIPGSHPHSSRISKDGI